MRGHNPVVLEDFNGLWLRGTPDAVPPDHFSDVNNMDYIESGFTTRDGVDPYFPFKNIKRAYTFIQTSGESILALDDMGNIFHSTSPTPNVPILTIPTMTDFGFVGYNGRAYLSPCDGSLGIINEFLYVYKGDGSQARKAGGTPPINGMTPFAAANSATAGNVEAGLHLFSVAYETDTGFITAPGVFTSVTADGTHKVTLSHIPLSPDTSVVARRIFATIIITNYTGNTIGYEYFYVPNGRIADNTTTTLDVNFYDADLLDSADNLFDLYNNPPATVGLALYHNRLVGWAENANPGVVRVSNSGQPEAINQVNGLITPPLIATPITSCQEYRDVLYIFRDTKTYSYTDNNDVPSSWSLTILDQGIGTSLHGICTVVDSGGVSADFLIILTFGGMYLFNGSYIRPELTYKIKDFWQNLDHTQFKNFQVVSNPMAERLFVSIKNNQILLGDYRNGLDPKSIKWGIWTFDFQTSTIALINTDTLIIGAEGSA